MNGPRLVCAGCGDPTSLGKPVCDDCMGLMAEVGHPICPLCERGFELTHGLHTNKDGGYVGRCSHTSLAPQEK